MLKGTKLYSILFNKCPRCHEGQFFDSNYAFSKKFSKMPKKCSFCGQSYEPEPGFYFGSMYASYTLYAATFVAFFVAIVVVLDKDPIYLLYFLLPTLVLLMPLYFRVARRLWINLFVKYDSNVAK